MRGLGQSAKDQSKVVGLEHSWAKSLPCQKNVLYLSKMFLFSQHNKNVFLYYIHIAFISRHSSLMLENRHCFQKNTFPEVTSEAPLQFFLL
jgi:hypothetical protein